MHAATARRRAIATAVLAVTLALLSRPARAQISTGSIAGAISDESGAVLPGVTITATNIGTAQQRTVVTNETGRYQLAGLPPGPYSVSAELAGFATVLRSQVTVTVGSIVDLDISMKLASVQETVTVSGEAPLIESAKTDLSSVITQQALESLPSKNRQYLDFALLLPTAVESVSAIQGTGAVVGGARSKEGTLLVDGFYNLDEGFTMPKQRHSQDTIQEFQLVTFGGAAEYGRAIGGVINAVTKSGTNTLGGTGYGFFRETALNAQAVEERLRGVPKSDYDRQQWGGSVGGPIVPNRTFFFAAAERLDESWPFDNGITATTAAIVGLPPEDVGTVPRFVETTFVFGKVDHNISANQRLQGSFSYTDAVDHQMSFPNPFATRSYTQQLPFLDWAYVGSWTNIAREGKWLHEVKASYFPRDYHSGGISLGGPPLVPDGQINNGDPTSASPPSVRITSAVNFGSATLANHIKTYPVQAIYTSSIFKDAHTVKFGVDYMYAHYDYNQYSPLRGQYSFSSLANFQRGLYSTYTQSFGAISNPRDHQYVSMFVQDSWQKGKRLTLNYGLRYDLELNPVQEASGVPFGNDFNNFGPRLALSWDVTDHGSTFLKLNTGLFYDRLWNNYTNNLYSLKDHMTRTSYTWTPTTPGAPVYPATFVTQPDNLPASARDVILMPADVRVPMSVQVVGTLDHALTKDIAVSVSGVWSESKYKDRNLDTNLVWDGARFIRPDANYRQITQLNFDAPADYLGAVFDVNVRSARVGLSTNLTVSRARQVPTGAPSDPRLGPKNDFGPVPDNATVRGVVSGWYNFTRNLQASANFTARSGIAVNPVAGGIDINGDGVFGDRTPTFGPYAFRAPGNNSLDARVTWMVPFRTRQRLNLYVESFNILNNDRIRTVDNNYGPNPASPLASWLRPTSYFPPREVQLGARLTF
jgi:hypothetical protein